MIEITNVGGCTGGEAFLIASGGSAALVDSGFSFCADKMIENIRAALGGRKLEYILLTHSHYDHASGSAYCRGAFPDAVVVASEYAAKVLSKPGAIKTMREMNDNIAEICGVNEYEDKLDDLAVDKTVCDGDEIALGDVTLRVVAAPGHTRCSIAFYCPEEDLLIGSETYGVQGESLDVMPAYLIGYQVTLDSIDKAAALHPKNILIPHMGLITGTRAEEFFARARKAAVDAKDMVVEGHRAGKSDEELVAAFKARYYTPEQAMYQPEKAFMLNASYIIPMLIRECGE
jgi:glyoxylase-like metal-dependent hydrolase (beta-lactamase superfamily II)